MGVFREFPTSRVVAIGFTISISIGLVGVLFGVGWLQSFLGRAPASSLYGLHWILMIYGFLNIFIVGVSSTLHPLFFIKKPSPKHSLPVLTILTIGEVLITISYLNYLNPVIGLTIMIIANLIYAAYIISILNLSNPYFYYGDLLSLTGFIAYPITLLLGLMQLINGSPTNTQIYYPLILLYSYAIPVIFGVMVRLIKFKFSKINLTASKATFYSYILGLITLYIGYAIGGANPLIIASILILIASIGQIYAVNMFEHTVEEPYRSRLKEGDWRKYIFFTRHLNTGAIWLILSSITLIIFSLNTSLGLIPGQIYLWDMAIHSLTIGFIGNIIVAYAGYMLPSIVYRKYAYRSLSQIPLILLNTGNALRIAGDTFRILNIMEPYTPHSGILILLAYIYAIIMVIRLMRE